MLKKYVALFFSFIFTIITISTVNSACTIIYGQDEEPESLKRFKKIK